MARANAAHNLNRHYGLKSEMRHYRCPFCNAFHNTSQEKKPK